MATFPLTAVPLLLRDSPVLAYGSFGGRPNRQIRVQVTQVSTTTDVSTVTATVLDGYLPIAEGDTVVFGGVDTDDDLSQGTFTIRSVVSQNFQTGVVAFTVDVDSTFTGAANGVAFIQPEPTAGETPNFGAYAVQEGCKGISWDTDGLSDANIQLNGSINVDGPWGIIGEAATMDQANIATLPAGVRFVQIVFNSGTGPIVSWICCF